MSEHNHLISVVIPCYNEEAYISDALESILNQSHESFEVIIIDDGSTDNTVQIIDKYDDSRLHLVKNRSNRGRSAARNKGLDRASGDFIIFHDADDMSHPDRFRLQLTRFTDNPDLLAVGSMMQRLNVYGESITHVADAPPGNIGVDHILRNGTPCSHAATMFRTNIIRQLGGYREEFGRAEDLDLWLRFFENYDSDRFEIVKNKLYYYRIYPRNSHHFFDSNNFAEMAKKSARLRALGESDAGILQNARICRNDRTVISKSILYSSYHYRLARLALSQNDYKSSANHFFKSIIRTPFLPKLWLRIAYSFLPSKIQPVMLRIYVYFRQKFSS